LAVHPDKEKRNLNFVWNLKQKGLIDQAIVSFSTAGPNKDVPSYAIFGGINEDQIVGGIKGLKKMQTFAYRPEWTQSVKQWALEGQTAFYGDEEYVPASRAAAEEFKKKKIPAIIDTGTNNIGVPANIFTFLKEKWQHAVPEVNCIDDDNFCFVMKKCDKVAADLSPVGF
jgi:hypothetical protein